MSLTSVDTVVIGAGHAGLAVSRLLTALGRDHLVLDRGRVGERWRTERWESLHLLTPSWITRLPGWPVDGDPDDYLTARQFVRHLERYADSFDAPVVTGTTARSLTRGARGYDVHTDHGTVRARTAVLATGPHSDPVIPAAVARADVPVLTSNRYHSPRQLASGGVLVVGASASGVQIADELVRSGRDVVLAVGRHTRMPRRYRGMDIFWWLETTGRLARTIDEMPDPVSARREPSMQLIGRGPTEAEPGFDEVDLDALVGRGVRLAGRLRRIDGTVATFGSGLGAATAEADARMHRFLDAVDRHVEWLGLTDEVWPAVRPAPLAPVTAPTCLDLRAEGITTVVLATGFRPDHTCVDLPIKAGDGSIRQRRGVTDAPGVYVVGQRFQHRRDSSFIDGARHDAYAVVTHLTTGALPSTSPGPRPVSTEEQA